MAPCEDEICCANCCCERITGKPLNPRVDQSNVTLYAPVFSLQTDALHQSAEYGEKLQDDISHAEATFLNLFDEYVFVDMD